MIKAALRSGGRLMLFINGRNRLYHGIFKGESYYPRVRRVDLTLCSNNRIVQILSFLCVKNALPLGREINRSVQKYVPDAI